MKKVKGRRTKETKGGKKLDLWMYGSVLQVCWSSSRWILFLIMPWYFSLRISFSLTWFCRVSEFLICSDSLHWFHAGPFPAGQTCHISTLVCTFLQGFGVGWCIVTVAKFRPRFCVSSVFSLTWVDILFTCMFVSWKQDVVEISWVWICLSKLFWNFCMIP